MGPTFNKIKKNIKSVLDRETARLKFLFFLYFYFSSLTSLFDIRKSDSQNSRGKKQSALLNEGYA